MQESGLGTCCCHFNPKHHTSETLRQTALSALFYLVVLYLSLNRCAFTARAAPRPKSTTSPTHYISIFRWGDLCHFGEKGWVRVLGLFEHHPRLTLFVFVQEVVSSPCRRGMAGRQQRCAHAAPPWSCACSRCGRGSQCWTPPAGRAWQAVPRRVGEAQEVEEKGSLRPGMGRVWCRCVLLPPWWFQLTQGVSDMGERCGWGVADHGMGRMCTVA